MSKPFQGKDKRHAEIFFQKLLTTLIEKNLPFMIGGTYAFNEYTGLDRPTGDIDIMCPAEDYPRILKTLSESDFETKLAEIELNWLAKVSTQDYYTDIIFAERNGLHKVERSWLRAAREGTVLDYKVKLVPVEEMIRSKAYVQNRTRSDAGDVVHLILRQGKTLDWKLLVTKMEPHWELLLAHILYFLFIYPSERRVIPNWVIEKLVKNLLERISHPPTKDRITRGLLLSNDYQVGVSKWGFKPITELK